MTTWQRGSAYGLDVDRAADWRERAACRDDPERMFPHEHSASGIKAAKAVCDRCPVVAECLAAAVGEEFGVWGGLTPEERREQKASAEKLPPTKPCAKCGRRFTGTSKNQRRCPNCQDGRSHKKPVAECGTRSGYLRHLDRGEPTCDPCRAANRRYSVELARGVAS